MNFFEFSWNYYFSTGIFMMFRLTILFLFKTTKVSSKTSKIKDKLHESRNSEKHVRPSHLSDDKYFILFIFFSVFHSAVLACAQIKVSQTTTANEASAYLFSFNTNSWTLDHCVCMWMAVSRWEQNKNETKRNFSVAREEKNSFFV